MLEVRGLSAWYGEAQVLHGVDLDVRRGEVVTLVGRNGAGKTTLLRCLLGLHRQQRGSVMLEGRAIDRLPPHRRARLGLGYVPDDRGVYATLSVSEHLQLPPIARETAWTVERLSEAFPVLPERARSAGTQLSGGEQQMLALARVLRMGARLLLLDEPTEGLAPLFVRRIGEIIRTVAADGVTVLLIEQNVRFASSVSDRHYVLAEGRVVESLTNEELRQQEGTLLRHLGV
ncbi:MAG: ABC transporter ATP-binding protein [Actinobacteria bacterium]|nr:ABC transporter ATP-binding protein [Actinomycetota bacterium]